MFVTDHSITMNQLKNLQIKNWFKLANPNFLKTLTYFLFLLIMILSIILTFLTQTTIGYKASEMSQKRYKF